MARNRRKVGGRGKSPRETPSSYEGWLKRARTFLSECQLSECYECDCATAALDAYDQAIKHLPDHPAAWREKGQLLVEKGQLLVRMRRGHESRTRGILTNALSLDPRNARTWMWLGACATQQGDWVAAREFLDTAISLDPEMRLYAEWEYDIPDELREPFFAGDPSLAIYCEIVREEKKAHSENRHLS